MFLGKLLTFLDNPDDLNTTPFYGGDADSEEQIAWLLRFETITNSDKIDRLIQYMLDSSTDIGAPEATFVRALKRKAKAIGKAVAFDSEQLAQRLYEGKSVLLIGNEKTAYVFNTAHLEGRPVSSSERENALIGPKDSFVENLETNISLIRRRLRHPDFVIETKMIGERTQQRLAVMYLGQQVNKEVLKQLTKKIDAMRMDLALDTTQVVHAIMGRWQTISPFPNFQNSERPDKIVSALLEGRIVLMLESSPTALIIPVTMSAMYQAVDDYYFPSISGSFFRFVRFLGLITTVFLPAIYVSITSVNQEVLRVQFMIAIAASREGVPYPAYIEVFIMMGLLELINEATVRLPKTIGGTATIVGGLIIGTAAAQSHMISNIMIVITAATAIGSYTVPNYVLSVAWRLCSYFLVLLAIPLGLYGITIGMSFIVLFLCTFKPWGIPYLAPFDTFHFRELVSDSLIRIPKRFMRYPSTYSKDIQNTRRIRMKREGGEL